MTHPSPGVRSTSMLAALAWALALSALPGLAGCGSAPEAPVLAYRLPLILPAMMSDPIAAPLATRQAATGEGQAPPVWQLQLPVALPELLDHGSLLLPQAGSGVLRATGHRWAEPLRDAVPRLLAFDLARLRGAVQVFAGPLPPGVVPGRQLRVQLLALEAAPDRRSVLLQARWTLADPRGLLPPEVGQVRLQAPCIADDPEALVAAHRLALWRLAQAIAHGV